MSVKVLILEDDDDLRKIWRRVLQSARFEVIEAATLEAALSKMPDADIALFDWRLDGGTADLALDRWVEEHGDKPLMVVSGYEIDDDLYSRGAWHVLNKPVDLAVLFNILQRYTYYLTLSHSVDDLGGEVSRLRKQLVVAVGVILGLLGAGQFPVVVEVVKGLL